ncbi:ribonuclease H-like domain-containing protein [Tanacetum coccineum]
MPANTLRRSSRQTKLPSSLNDFIVEGKVKYGVERVVNYANLNHDNYCFVSALNKSVEPTCYEEAILDSNWIDAMNSEIEALNENHTWIITDLSPERKAIGNKWIYKIKYKSSGDIDRYKPRLVVKDEDIYMTIPKGFASKDNNNKVCKLVKSFYGLKQAPKKWNEKLVTILKENGFVQSVNGHSLFTKAKDNKFIALLVSVDDIVVTENCVDEIDKCLKGAPGKGIRYKYTDCKNNLTGYSDADWTKCLKTIKSVTDCCFEGLKVEGPFLLFLILPWKALCQY